MKIVVTGAKGQLGTDLLKEFATSYPNDEIVGIDRDEVDLTNHDAVIAFFKQCKPDAIMHLAAYTAVDKAEDNVEACEAINVGGTKNIVEAAKLNSSKLLYISTDYVFDGTKKGVYEVNDKKNPLSVYGRTKSEGEDVVRSYSKSFIVRTSWVFGKYGHNFVYTMMNLGRAGKELRVIDDQIGSPTYTPDLSKLIASVIHSEKYGIYHGTNEGYVSWYEFTKKIFELSGIKEYSLTPVPSSAYQVKATRPMNSRLSKDCLTEAGFKRLPTWEDALKRFLIETDNYQKGE